MRVWTEALIDRGIVDEARDGDRVLAAFRYVAAHADTWPSPSQLIRCLPEVPREYFRALPKPEETPEQRLADHQRRRQVINVQRAALDEPPLPDYDPAEAAKPVDPIRCESEEERRASRAAAERHLAALRAKLDREEGVNHGAP